jgi:hypothetical protein
MEELMEIEKKIIEENENNMFKIGFLEVDDNAIRL